MTNTIVVIDKKNFAEHYDVECRILVPDVLRVFRKYCTKDTKLMAMVCANDHMFECKLMENGYWELTVSTHRTCHKAHVRNFKM